MDPGASSYKLRALQLVLSPTCWAPRSLQSVCGYFIIIPLGNQRILEVDFLKVTRYTTLNPLRDSKQPSGRRQGVLSLGQLRCTWFSYTVFLLTVFAHLFRILFLFKSGLQPVWNWILRGSQSSALEVGDWLSPGSVREPWGFLSLRHEGVHVRSPPAINTNVHVPGARRDAELRGRKTVALQSYTGILIKL